MTDLRIDHGRLWASLQELAQIGGFTDDATDLRGVNRLALTQADAEGRRLVKRWFEEAGLEVRVDRIGNTYGRRAGRAATAAPVLSGSHIDSVPTGGAFVLRRLFCLQLFSRFSFVPIGWDINSLIVAWLIGQNGCSEPIRLRIVV